MFNAVERLGDRILGLFVPRVVAKAAPPCLWDQVWTKCDYFCYGTAYPVREQRMKCCYGGKCFEGWYGYRCCY